MLEKKSESTDVAQKTTSAEQNTADIEQKPTTAKAAVQQPSILKEIIRLVIKIGAIVLMFFLLFTFVFGVEFSRDDSMAPAMKNSDIVIYYRWDKSFAATEVAVVEFEGQRYARRVVAVAGDTVDITEDGLVINGAPQNEKNIYTETLPYLDGIQLPVTLQENEIFLLADFRDGSVDSRIFGPVNADKVLGKAVTVIRKSGI